MASRWRTELRWRQRRSGQQTAWALVAVFGLWAMASAQAADEPADQPSRSSSRAGAHADEQNLERRLDEILENDEKILTRFTEVMKELQVVKVRASLKKHPTHNP